MQSWIKLITTLFRFWPLVVGFVFVSALALVRSRNIPLRNIWHILFVVWIILAALGIVTLDHGSYFPRIPYLLFFVGCGIVVCSISLSYTVRKIIDIQKKMADQDSLAYLQELSAHDFELLVADFFLALGFRTRPSEDIQDHGVDVVVYDGKGEKWIVQCKRYRGIVGEPILRDLLGTMLHEKASRAFLMTTGKISRKAKMWIEGKPITVYEGEGLLRIFNILKKRM